MARSLLAPTAFVTLLGLAAVPAAAGPAAAGPETAAPGALVAYATTRSGNARAPSYDDAMMMTKGGPDSSVEVEAGGPREDAPQAVVLVLETALDLPLALTPTDLDSARRPRRAARTESASVGVAP
ncbi:MAG: hypothetical protein Q8P18_31820 [Pseudomonadota bacterium]|nr:hypothetical protein [Pseudomonadota bacterium]